MIELVVRLTIAGGLLAAALWALPRVWRSMPKTLAYYLWLLVLLRFVLPVGFPVPARQQVALPEPAVQTVQTTHSIQTAPQDAVFWEHDTQAQPQNATDASMQQVAEEKAAPDWGAILGVIWIGGALFSFGLRAALYARFACALRRDRRLRLRVGRVRVYRAQVTTPLVLGVLRPAVYVPETLSGRALALALRHELTHVRRGDVLYKWAVQAVAALHWFNPMAYLMVRETARLCECSCDARVARGLTPEGRKDYARLLLTFADPRRVPATELAGGGKKQLEARVRGALGAGGKLRRAAVVLAVCCTALALTLAACAGAVVDPIPTGGDAAKPEQVTPATEDEIVEIMQAYEAEDYETVIRLAPQALAEQSGHVTLWLTLSQSYAEMEMTDEAVQTAQDGYRQTASWFLMRQWVFLTCEPEKTEISTWEQAISAFLGAINGGGDTYYKSAERYARAAIEEDPANPALYALLGECCLAMEDLEQAAAAFDEGYQVTENLTLGERAATVYESVGTAEAGDRAQILREELAGLYAPDTTEPYSVMLLAQAGREVRVGTLGLSDLPGARAYFVTVDGFGATLYRYTSPEGALDGVSRISPDGLWSYGDGEDNATFQGNSLTPVHWYRCEGELLALYCGDLKTVKAVSAALGVQFAGGADDYSDGPLLESSQLIAAESDRVLTYSGETVAAFAAALRQSDWQAGEMRDCAPLFMLDFLNGTEVAACEGHVHAKWQTPDGMQAQVYDTPAGIPDALRALFAPPATCWVDMWESYPEDEIYELTLYMFPGRVFRCGPYEVTATYDGRTETLIGGMPVWDVYLADLNGDGCPEFCATSSFGSGLIDTRVQVYDYANGKHYELEARGDNDYYLTLQNGCLYVTKTPYPYNGQKDTGETAPIWLDGDTLRMENE